jgi:predicted PurR-regulated permease PerM
VKLQQNLSGSAGLSLAIEGAIYIGLAIMLVVLCLLILRPFIPLLTWGIIIAVAVYPAYRKLKSFLGGRDVLTATVCTVVLLAVLIVPIVMLAESVVHGIEGASAHLREGTAVVPPPPSGIENWPIIGVRLRSVWALASQDVTQALSTFAPQIKAALPTLLSASAGIARTALELLLSILVSGFLLAHAQAGHELTLAMAKRIFGARGPEFRELIGATIRSVTLGILGVALIQSACAAVGFLLVGLPAPGIWTVIFILAAVVQVGGLVLIPAVIYVFAVGSVTKAVIFTAWCLLVGVMDNVLKPLLLGRGVAVPIAVVFLGAIGGFVALGIIGLFVGAIVLSVGYKLFLAWLDKAPAVLDSESAQPAPADR